jgi:hypothetical protein
MRSRKPESCAKSMPAMSTSGALHPFLAVADAQDHVGREFVEVQQLLVAEFGRRILQQRAETPACPSC